MRISGGKARGIPLTVPKGDAVRPATDGLRQSVFSSIASRIPGAHFLDLCAGSGSYGLEAISRGAASGCFVEKNAKAATCLRANIAAVCKSAAHDPRTLHVSQCDLAAWTPPAGSPPPELVFIDPPYEIIDNLAPIFFAKTAEWLAASTDPVIVFEMPGELTLTTPPAWTLAKRLGGKSPRQPTVCFYLRTK
ncbi:RsmD family RNA methyltransferase [Ereboglobus luteus]|uniref:Methyltransferase n=1 Tax=Ereboglobus luteus TaxID=1796921 RepID=A0A2U8E4R4_9BACT|nr:RsmD family RNA methyltransferase [Ereboglobus luteus]AWI09853.1 methyltransferase [Ereboglobus luteus]